MGVVNYILGIGAIWLVINCYAFYKSVQPKSCRLPKGPCLRPLFPSYSPVDVYFFATNRLLEKGEWRKPEGFGDLIPVWNRTDVRVDEIIDDYVRIPKTLATEMRKNESLYAHVFVVKSGLSPNASEHHRFVSNAKQTRLRYKTKVGKYEGLLHITTPLTRHLVPSTSVYTKLLGDSALGNKTEGAGKTMKVHLPLGLPAINLEPVGTLKWCALAFIGTSFTTPTLKVAAFRQFLAVIVVPYLVKAWISIETAHLAELAALEKAMKTLASKQAPQQPYAHMRPRLSIRLAYDDGIFSNKQSPVLYYTVNGQPVRYSIFSNSSTNNYYIPPMYIDDSSRASYGLMRSNTSLQAPIIAIKWHPMGRMQYSLLKMMEESVSVWAGPGGILGEDGMDEIKYLFRRPLHILLFTYLISVVQMILSTLAFKNDVTFFRGRQDYTGLSSRSIITDAMHSLVIFLYVLDFEHASKIVVWQLGSGTAIGLWKVSKRLRLGIFWRFMLPWVGPKGEATAQITQRGERVTEDIDAKGMRYLTYVLYPLSIGWGIYCLVTYRYKSWWSWFISAAADFAYSFGFINMMPQIFINYKLKSVAHMPWRVMIYKFFNTFIDDVFAFFIMADRMSAKHRWMTLRDDIVFFMFLYQLYLYPVDSTRPDEYGFVYLEKKEKERKRKEKEKKAITDAVKDKTTTKGENKETRDVKKEKSATLTKPTLTRPMIDLILEYASESMPQ